MIFPREMTIRTKVQHPIMAVQKQMLESEKYLEIKNKCAIGKGDAAFGVVDESGRIFMVIVMRMKNARSGVESE